MKKSNKILAILIAIVLVFGILAGCSDPVVEESPLIDRDSGQSVSNKNVDGGEESPADTSVDGEPKDTSIVIGTLNTDGAYMASLGTPSYGYSLVYDTMIKYNSETEEYEPHLVTGWEFNEDCTELVLTFRDDVYFSNGDLMTPEDALFSMHTYVGAQNISSTSYTEIDWEACSVDGNDLTVAFTNPCPAFLATISAPTRGAVLSKAYVESCETEDLYTSAVGTGPYVLEEAIMNSYTVYKIRDDYWGELPDAEQVTIKYYTEPTAMFVDYETGGIDIAVGIQDADLIRMQNGETDGWYDLSPLNDYINLTLPEYNEAFDDIRVRQAIAHAIDYDALTIAIMGQLGVVATSVIPDAVPGHVNVGTYEYNPELARSLLAEAGIAEGELSLRLVIVNSISNQNMAEALQAYFADVGINLIIEAYDFVTALTYFMMGDTDLSISELNYCALDPSQCLFQAEPTSTNSCVRLTDEAVTELIYAAKYCQIGAERDQLLEDVQYAMHGLYRWLPICYKYCAIACNDRIAPFNTFALGYWGDLTAIKLA